MSRKRRRGSRSGSSSEEGVLKSPKEEMTPSPSDLVLIDEDGDDVIAEADGSDSDVQILEDLTTVPMRARSPSQCAGPSWVSWRKRKHSTSSCSGSERPQQLVVPPSAVIPRPTLTGLRRVPPSLSHDFFQDVRAYREKYKNAFQFFDFQIMRHFVDNIQKDATYWWKMEVRRNLWASIRTVHQNAGLYVVGSTINGCGSFSSDMDLCCHIQPRAGFDDDYSDRQFASHALRKIQKILYRHRAQIQMKNCTSIRAKVPILRITFNYPYEDLEVDLNVNNLAGISNSHLCHYYSRVDDRLPALCLLVKHWAKRNGIGEAVHGTLNSYSLILLCIHFLQVAVTPAILPNLQQTHPHLFTADRPPSELFKFHELEPNYPDPRLNKSTVGELLIGFFEYYARFDFNNWAISVKNANVFERSRLPEDTRRFKMFIEEPYDGQNTARCVTQVSNFAKILEAFRRARSAFLGKRPPDLRRIGVTELFITKKS